MLYAALALAAAFTPQIQLAGTPMRTEAPVMAMDRRAAVLGLAASSFALPAFAEDAAPAPPAEEKKEEAPAPPPKKKGYADAFATRTAASPTYLRTRPRSPR